MANLKDKEKELKETLRKEREELRDIYADIQNLLIKEGEKLQDDIRREYKQAKTYVEKNPETGVGAALASGFVLGLLVAKLFRK